MCIIIDADVASDLVPPSEDAKPVVDSIEQRKLLLVIGGRNTEELHRHGRVGRWLRGLLRANVVRSIGDPDLEREERVLETLGTRLSNDVHILALARASGARLLFSRDNALGQDFKNKAFLDGPRGSIYKQRSHLHLLRSATCSRRPR